MSAKGFGPVTAHMIPSDSARAKQATGSDGASSASHGLHPALRVCFLLESYHPFVGGMETHARDLARDLRGQGISVIVLTRRIDGAWKRYEVDGGIAIHRVRPVGTGQLKRWAMVLSCIPKLIQLRRQYDVLYIVGFRTLGMSAVPIAGFLGKSCILRAESNGEMSGEFFEAGLKRVNLSISSWPVRSALWLRNRLLRQAAQFVAISTAIRDEFIRCAVSPAKIELIPNFVDTERFRSVNGKEKRALRKRLGIPLNNTVVVYTGRLVSYKGLPLLLHVWKEIGANRQGITLLMVGSGGSDIHNCEQELKDYAVKNALQDSVLFTGDVTNVHEYLQAADIYVFPTENEAFGISLIEAMASGLPSISTQVGGVKDIISDHENGLVFAAGNFKQFKKAMETLLQNESLRAKLAAGALRAVQEKFARGTVVQRYVDLFGRVLQNQPN